MDVEDAVERASQFLVKSGYLMYKLIAVKLDKSKQEWNLKFDVGAFLAQYVDIAIDDTTGRVVSYERQA